MTIPMPGNGSSAQLRGPGLITGLTFTVQSHTNAASGYMYGNLTIYNADHKAEKNLGELMSWSGAELMRYSEIQQANLWGGIAYKDLLIENKSTLQLLIDIDLDIGETTIGEQLKQLLEAKL